MFETVLHPTWLQSILNKTKENHNTGVCMCYEYTLSDLYKPLLPPITGYSWNIVSSYFK